MSQKKNLFHLWLGLPPKLYNPNRFQLLGIDPRSKDEAAIKKKATLRAKQLLQKLKQVQVNSDAQKTIKQKLQAKIVLSQKTMISPEKRHQYLQSLVAKGNSGKRHAYESEVLDPAAFANPSPPPQQKQPPPQKKQPAPAATPAEIPSAIPMALPVSSPPLTSKTANVAEDSIPDFSGNAAQQSNSEPNFDGLDSEPTVRVYTRKRKTSRSMIVPLVFLVLIVGGIGGLISMLTRYSNIFEMIPGLKDKVENVAQNNPGNPPPTTAPATESASGSASAPAPKPLPNIDAVNANAGTPPTHFDPDDPNPMMKDGNNEGSSKKAPTESMLPKDVKPVAAMKDSQSSEDTGNPFDIDENETEAGNDVDATVKTETKTKKGAATVSDEDLTAIRLSLLRSRDALFYQNTDLAVRYAVDAQRTAKELGVTNPKTMSPEQRSLVEALKQNKQMAGWLDDFWDQVKRSSIEQAGSQEITIGDKTMAMVEGQEEHVVLRIAGQNEFIKHRELTPVLAVTIGDMGSKKSVPRWNLAKAAFLGVMSEQNDDLLSTQSMFLSQAEIAGFDLETKVIRDYTKPQWLKLGLPKKKMKPLTKEQFEESITRFRKDLGYKDPSEVSAGLTGEYVTDLTLTPKKRLNRRVACLWEAIALIKNGGLISDLGYVNRELDACLTEVDFNRSFVDPIYHIAAEKKDAIDQDMIARQSINFIKRYDGNPNLRPELRTKLISLVQKISQELDNRQLQAMAEQLSNGKG